MYSMPSQAAVVVMLIVRSYNIYQKISTFTYDIKIDHFIPSQHPSYDLQILLMWLISSS